MAKLEGMYVYVEGPNGLYEEPDMSLGFYTELGSGMGGITHSVVSIVVVDGQIQSIWTNPKGAEKYVESYRKKNPQLPTPIIQNWQVWEAR